MRDKSKRVGIDRRHFGRREALRSSQAESPGLDKKYGFRPESHKRGIQDWAAHENHNVNYRNLARENAQCCKIASLLILT